MQTPLTLENLTLPKERTYEGLVIACAAILWLLLTIGIFPLAIALWIGLLLWFANGLLVAQLKSDAVQVTPEQLPALDQALRSVAARLQLAQAPELYVVQSGGLLNAFATRHCGRNFVVVFSEMLEAHGPDSAEVRFVLGHELGHIKRSHLLKRLLLFPGMLMPLLGNAYSRACESSCDRHGAFAADNPDASVAAMMMLAGGRGVHKVMNPQAFAAQHRGLRGFFVSWYELISGYPTNSQRVAELLALKDGQPPAAAPRHPLAYVFAFFTFGGRHSGGGNLFVTVAVIALLAAVAMPAFVKAREEAQRAQCRNNLRKIELAGEMVRAEKPAASFAEIAAAEQAAAAGLKCPKSGYYQVDPAGMPACTVHGTKNSLLRSPRAPLNEEEPVVP